MNMHVVIACGSRDWDDRRMIATKLAELERKHDFLVVLEGGARGADRIAGQWAAHARTRGVGWIRMAAEWEVHHPEWCVGDWCRSRRSCLGAGPRRNQAMLDYALGAPECSVLAFKDGFDWTFKKGGTEDMVQRASLAEVRGRVVHHVAA